MSDDFDAAKMAAVAALRAALLRGSGVGAALRRICYQHPLYGSALFVVALQWRFGSDYDVRQVTALTARVRAGRPGNAESFPAREAELAIRVALGELALVPELLRLPMNSQEIAITVLSELFSQWRPEPDEVVSLLNAIDETVAEVGTLAEDGTLAEEFGPDLLPQLWRALGNWFEAGMHESPFAFGTPGVRRETGRPPWDDVTLTDQARLARYDQEVDADPANVWYLTSRASMLEAMSRFDEAMADYDRAVRIDPADPRPIVGRGTNFIGRGQLEEALAEYERALELDPENHDAVAGRADVYAGLHLPEQALAEISWAMELDPDGHKITQDLLRRVAVYRQMGRLDEALADGERAAAMYPDSSVVLVSRGGVFHAMERHDEALADFQRAVELDPDFALAFGGRGDAYRYLERYEEAVADYDRAIELDPKDPLWPAGRGEADLELGRPAAALADFSQAIELDSGNPWTISGRGEGFRQLGKYAEALADFDRLLDADPDDANALASRGMTYQAMGRTKDAMADFERAIALDPDLRDELMPYLTPAPGQPD